jgi:hypothetical protein
MRDVLLEHMTQGLYEYRIQSAVFIGHSSGRLISQNDIMDGHDSPGGLRITMQSGHEYDLTMTFAEQADEEEDVN